MIMFVAPPVGAYVRHGKQAPERIHDPEAERRAWLILEARKMYKTKPESIERLLKELEDKGYIYEERFDTEDLAMIITVEKDLVKAGMYITYRQYTDAMALSRCIEQCVKKVDLNLKGENT